DRVVAEELLERSVAEDVVRQLADELTPLFLRQRRPGERQLLGHRLEDGVAEIGLALLEELGPELRDARVVDARLELRVRIERDFARAALGGVLRVVAPREAVVKAHRALLAPHEGQPPAV